MNETQAKILEYIQHAQENFLKYCDDNKDVSDMSKAYRNGVLHGFDSAMVIVKHNKF